MIESIDTKVSVDMQRFRLQVDYIDEVCFIINGIPYLFPQDDQQPKGIPNANR
jgi:hypothetical protein